MIKAIIFDIDNTLLDFMTMKSNAINAAVDGMIANGLDIEKETAVKEIFDIYNFKGYEHQKVLNEFITNTLGHIALTSGRICELSNNVCSLPNSLINSLVSTT